jgi:hypothetical protein
MSTQGLALSRYRRHDASVFLYAFDLIELNGDDLRREPLAVESAWGSDRFKPMSGTRLNVYALGDQRGSGEGVGARALAVITTACCGERIV